jgi:putrescine transport system permease protein
MTFKTKGTKAGPSEILWQRIIALLPFAWLVLFFLAPFFLVLKLSFSKGTLSQPPYEPVFNGLDASFFDKLCLLSFDTYRGLVEDFLYLQAYLNSLLLAGTATVLTLLVAYPLALAIARSPAKWRGTLLTLALLPFWTSFLIRVYAWILILKEEGLLNRALLAMGVIDQPLQIFATNTAVAIGIVYSYLPFMILPIYVAIEKQDPKLLEAAEDLGASSVAAFFSITLPLSLSGMLAGSLLVFIPAMGEFIIPDLLGGSDTLMIGTTLWNDFFVNRDWPTASAMAVVLLILLVVPLALFERIQMRGRARG